MATIITLNQEQTRPELASKGASFSRLHSIDFLRGLVMIIMVLDHTRDFIHRDNLLFDPTDMSQTYPALFFTRWITHFCAPVFIFLAGTSIYLQQMRGSSKKAISYFLLTRGLWLVMLEFTVVRFGIMFDLDYQVLGAMAVIWAIGISMIFMAAIVFLPVYFVGAFGVFMIFSHNLLDGIQLQGWQGPGSALPGMWEQLWFVLHQPFQLIFPFGSEIPYVFVLYPLIPWVGVMAAGYAFGTLYQLHSRKRIKILYWIGGSAIALFIMIRSLNLYGDPNPWSVQDSWIMTLASVLNVTKYPPSLSYLLIMLGISLLLLALLDNMQKNSFNSPVIIFGRVPLFFYLLQWPLMHALAVLSNLALDKPINYLFGFRSSVEVTPDMGYSLWVVYLYWIIGIIILYPLCSWFAGVKQRHKQQWWLSYL